MTAAAALMLAWLIDHRFGEPRSAWHPVAWFGRIATPAGHAARALAPPLALVAGAALWFALVGSVAVAAHAVERWAAMLPAWLAVPLLALALKPAFAWRMLKDEVRGVDAALEQGLEQGRARVARLCSRDVSALDAAGVRETAIETLAENFNDSLVAPLLWFLIAGLPGAWAWRAANTLDAMWGYRGDWEWAGKWAARADDLMAWVPARLAALLLWQPGLNLAQLTRLARLTPSPNGGWPMAAMALRIGTRLGKPGVYTLNADAPAPGAAALADALASGEQAARRAILCALTIVVAMAARQAAPT
jgi:adenosylcobinamide-phosphate synthase